jgi:hypothetical protein
LTDTRLMIFKSFTHAESMSVIDLSLGRNPILK